MATQTYRGMTTKDELVATCSKQRAANFVVVAIAVIVTGCGVGRGVDTLRIHGVWSGPGCKFAFYSDGTCEVNGRTGKYEVLDANRLKVTFKGLVWGESEEYVTYSFSESDSVLTIKAKFFGAEMSAPLRKE